MKSDKNEHETRKQNLAGELDSAGETVETVMERGAEAYAQAERAVGNAYDKTVKTVSETYDKAKNYGCENPGKTIFIALGIGIGMGLLLGARSHRSRSSRIAEPVVNALSDVALAFFR